MTLYRLLDTKDAKFFTAAPFVFITLCVLACPCMLLFVRDQGVAYAVSLLGFLVAAVCLPLTIAPWDWYSRYAMLDGNLLKVCTKKGKIIRTYQLRNMDKICAFVSYGQRGGLFLKGLLLYEKGLYLNGEYTVDKEGYILQVNFYKHSRKEQKKMVVIQNKVLEEKILAYYDEQPIEGQE